DLVLFCVKSFDTESAAQTLLPVIGPDTGVLSIQNGVDNEEKLERIVGTGHVLGGVALVFATIAGPGAIQHFLLGKIQFGEMDGRDSSRARAFLAACERAAIPCELSREVARTLWQKYVFLVAQSGMSALTRCPAGAFRAVPETRQLYRSSEPFIPRPHRGRGQGEGQVLAACSLYRTRHILVPVRGRRYAPARDCRGDSFGRMGKMMYSRHTGGAILCLVICSILAVSLAAPAQPAGKIYRIGFLSSQTASAIQPQLNAFKQKLRDLGYVEGGNLIIEYRWAQSRYDRLPVLARELVR